MGGSLSQRRTDPVMSLINAFSIEELYTPEFSNSFQENTNYWQEPNPHESLFEQVVASPPKMKKPTRARQKRPIQNDDAPRKHGNARKQDGFWCEVLQNIESKTKQYGRRTYDMESGGGDEDYINRAMIQYQAETGLPFKFCHCWEVSKDSPKWQEIALSKFATESGGGSKRHKSSGSSLFNTESGNANINLNTNAGDNDEDEVQEIRRPGDRAKARAAGKNKG
ncbi:ALP1-like protein [Tanacetum coccineum]|uniref:ALP1-like protein n=1 Tax=Tanacetum coccineum TaxID=301880 RepID=A0ABQ5CAW7_9ASTR